MSIYKEIFLPKSQQEALLVHCRRKWAEDYLPEENHARKAYGLIAGQSNGDKIVVTQIFPLKKNTRKDNQYDEEMTQTMQEHAIPSQTPFERRGWVADPQELYDIYQEADKLNMELFGAYHMHVVSWPPHDPLRDIPTEVDAVLAKDSNMYVFIISMVDPEKPIIRVFFESRLDQEIPIVFTENNND